MKLQERMLRAIKKRTGNVILRQELSGLGSASQITEALKALQASSVIVRIGTGVYAKTRQSSVTGAMIAAGSLETLGVEALRKLGVPVAPGKAAAAYNAGTTTQIPGVFIVNTGRQRISRRISVGGRTLKYESDFGRAATTA
jgi:pyridoxine 5'-phosphate synthase PdxJ